MELVLKDVTKKFGENVILKNVNLKFESGKIYGFIGRNGSGKSVLLKLICGFYTVTSGEILLDGINYSEKNSFPEDTRALIEKPNFIPDLTGFENLKLLASIQNKINDDQIKRAMEEVNIPISNDKKYSKYSLGTKQKLGIAQVLMEDPKIIILDEPFNGIENETVKKLRKVLLKEKKKGKIIILATHIKEDIDELADVVYEVDNGIITEIKKNNRVL